MTLRDELEALVRDMEATASDAARRSVPISGFFAERWAIELRALLARPEPQPAPSVGYNESPPARSSRLFADRTDAHDGETSGGSPRGVPTGYDYNGNPEYTPLPATAPEDERPEPYKPITPQEVEEIKNRLLYGRAAPSDSGGREPTRDSAAAERLRRQLAAFDHLDRSAVRALLRERDLLVAWLDGAAAPAQSKPRDESRWREALELIFASFPAPWLADHDDDQQVRDALGTIVFDVDHDGFWAYRPAKEIAELFNAVAASLASAPAAPRDSVDVEALRALLTHASNVFDARWNSWTSEYCRGRDSIAKALALLDAPTEAAKEGAK